MEDETAKEENQPSTSKKESERVGSRQDIHNDKRKHEDRRRRDDRDDRGDDLASDSDSYTSGSYISDKKSRSRMDIENDGPVPVAPQHKTQDIKAKAPQKKSKRGRRPGRVQKRRRTPARRRGLRNRTRRRPREERQRIHHSMSTISSRSSRIRDRTPGCKHCGHRCCRRRYEYEMRRAASRKRRQARKARQRTPPPDLESERLQVGSRCNMLSPLFINSNATPQELPEPTCSYCEITPEMIYEAVKTLTMWKQYVLLKPIMDHLKRYYPVNQDDNELEVELREKLRVAEIVGIVVKPLLKHNFFNKVSEDHRWCLNCALQKNRALSESHVTRFWQVYADTMAPIKKQLGPKDKLK